MNIRKSGAIAGVLALALALSACGGTKTPSSTGSPTGGTTTSSPTGSASAGGADMAGYSLANVVNGYLGDQGFFDDGDRGVKALVAAGATEQTLQADPKNPAQWKANLESVAGKYDMVVVGTSQMVDLLTETAPKYPEQKFLIYDAVVKAPNVASITYAQNEGSFLAGVLAALVTSNKAEFPMSNDQKVIGAVGGMDIPVINDFMAGFKAGAAAVDPNIKVIVSYVGNFDDSQKGYEQAKAMINQGADVVFQVAGGAGVGALQAAKELKVYGIGVDQNQNQLQPGHILASMLKNVGKSVETAVKAAKAGTLKFGETTVYGLANDGVGLDFDNNNNLVPQKIMDEVLSYKQKVVDGQIKVPTASAG